MPSLTGAALYEQEVQQNIGLGQQFFRHVRTQPEAIAVAEGSATLTYSELHVRALGLASILMAKSLRPQEPVGVIAQHGTADIVSQVAIVYAGGICTPMDPLLPDEQIEGRLQRLGVRMVLTDGPNNNRSVPFQLIDMDKATNATERLDEPVTTDLESLTHLIHTSGTTSQPKAVQIAAGSILHVAYNSGLEPLHSTDVVAHVNNTSFDVSLFDIWCPLVRGAQIAVMSKTTYVDPPAMAAEIDRLGITAMAFPHAVLNLAATTYPQAFSKLRVCLVGGEAANVSAMEIIMREGPPELLFNAYGPTECCIFCLVHLIQPEDIKAGAISIGLPIGENTAYIANDAGKESVEGELWISGPGLSPGYVNQPEKNIMAFPTVQLDGKSVRFYRTGDLVRRRPDGQIDFVGRKDNQVKIPCLRTGLFTGAGSILVAYAVPLDLESSSTVSESIRSMKRMLPSYMVPQIELIDRLPLNNHAKIDRRRLSDHFALRYNAEAKAASPGVRSPTKEVLGLPADDIRGNDDFFLLGATSIQAALFVGLVRQKLGVDLSLMALYDNSTLNAAAQLIMQHMAGQFNAVIDERATWVADSKLTDDISFTVGEVPDWTDSSEGRVFVTGATGFVGAFFLADLLQMPNIKSVHCLAGMVKYGVWNDAYEHKIDAIPGSLEKADLGMGSALFDELAQSASVVFHLAAHVNYTHSYTMHRPANTIGTLNIARFAAHGRTKPLHYVSSISCFGPTGLINGTTHVQEDEALSNHLDALQYDHGYAQSQWVADEMIKRLYGRGYPAAIYRPGFVTGHSKTGACNPDDFFSRFVRASCEMGCFPHLPDQRKEFVPVDYISSVLLHISAKRSAFGRAYHLVPPKKELSLDMDDTMVVVGEAHKTPLKAIAYNDWMERLSTDCPRDLLPLRPMLTEQVFQDVTPLADYPGGLEFPMMSKVLMSRYLSFLTKC
ncbi:acetyl-CoA synthetase-like protein [Myriangium duriaei CBS 260.36]|uniref:Acetyl-CoA synthetase-like protein n=1 Tax=Myriangium duriaei CBS 260.36 TaxID=1168546 RepID=A0A9P4J2X4_9PEZI|nr:acetyl-CoA synthetase-like protein [Myriangium duriaei CBS 260.36]